MVKNNSESDSDRERKATAATLTTPSTDRIAHTTAFVTPVMEHWQERKIVQPWGINE